MGEMLDDSEKEAALFEPGKLPRMFVLRTVEHFKSHKVIHKRYIVHLLISAKHYYEKQPSLLEIPILTVGPNKDNLTVLPRLTVCNDTHGQYYDVMKIFKLNGLPSKNNSYLFNGDSVDCGSLLVDFILTLLLFKMSDPECIHLHRGNHKTRNTNKIYGFEGSSRPSMTRKYSISSWRSSPTCY